MTTKNIKIAYDYQIFGGQRYGGISRYFFELANNIAQRDGICASVVSPIYINSYLSQASEDLEIIGRKMPAIKGSWRLYKYFNKTFAPAKLESLKPDIVHETYYGSTRLGNSKSRTVVTVYDMIHELFPSSFLHSDDTSYLKAKAVERADHVICISRKTQSDLIKCLNISPDKTSVIYLGVRLNQLTSNLYFESAKKRPYFLYVGDRAGYKNFKTTLEMYGTSSSLRQDYDLVIFGGGHLKPYELELIKKFNIPTDKLHHEMGGDSKLINLYKNASVFIYPSYYEGFGMPPLEAMSLRCPVVCSNASAMPEVLGNAAEFFDPYSSSSLETAIEKIVRNERRKNELIDLGLRRVEQFTWDKCAKDTLAVYRTLC